MRDTLASFFHIVACLALFGAGVAVLVTGNGVGAHLAAALLIGSGATIALFGGFLQGVMPGQRPGAATRREDA